jgi:hypothetical protein
MRKIPNKKINSKKKKELVEQTFSTFLTESGVSGIAEL